MYLEGVDGIERQICGRTAQEYRYAVPIPTLHLLQYGAEALCGPGCTQAYGIWNIVDQRQAHLCLGRTEDYLQKVDLLAQGEQVVILELMYAERNEYLSVESRHDKPTPQAGALPHKSTPSRLVLWSP